MILNEYLGSWHGICGMSHIFRNLGQIPEETAHVLQNLVSANGLTRRGKTRMYTVGIVVELYTVPL